jgi:hypothetical protein
MFISSNIYIYSVHSFFRHLSWLSARVGYPQALVEHFQLMAWLPYITSFTNDIHYPHPEGPIITLASLNISKKRIQEGIIRYLWELSEYNQSIVCVIHLRTIAMTTKNVQTQRDSQRGRCVQDRLKIITICSILHEI